MTIVNSKEFIKGVNGLLRISTLFTILAKA
jgi:hypothetical protein